MTPIFMDLESQSLCDLSAVGGRVYARHPSTKLLCACFSVDKEIYLWSPSESSPVAWPAGFEKRPFIHHTGKSPPWWIEHLAKRPWVAHNGDEFDSLVWIALGLPQPVEWIDTMPSARLAGYAGALDSLSERFCGIGKNKAAVRILQRVCKQETVQPGELAVIASYNIADVLALEVIYDRLHRYTEPSVYEAAKRINERGVRFDRRLAGDLLRLSAENVTRAAAEIERLTGGFLKPDDLTKRNRVLQWIEREGLKLKSIARPVVQQLLDDPETFLRELPDDAESD